MLYDKPIPFAEALKSRKGRKLLATSAGSAEIAKLGPDILRRATFSAKLAAIGPVTKLDKLLAEMTSPAARAAKGLGAIDAGTFRLEMREALAKAGYAAPDGKENGLLDHTSDTRLNLILKTNLDQAYGYGQYAQGQDPDLLDLWPCQELTRVESREQPRGNGTYWPREWQAKGGKLFGGRMIARKDSNIWTAISRFSNPYPPFDYMSGMGLRDVRRKEAEELGVIKRSDIVKPTNQPLNENISAAMPQGISKGLADVLQQVFKVVGERIILEGAQ